MPCYAPIQAWRSFAKNANGKSIMQFKKQLGSSSLKFEPIKVSCGQCIGCRLERSRQWAIRCMYESTLYSRNCFITLTYNPKYLPEDGSLKLRHFQLFFKRLRKKYGKGIRFFHCGEYGEKNFRPHYHAIIFNHDFSDKKVWKTHNGQTYFISQQLDQLWSDPDTGESLGFSTIGDVTFDSAAYVARYITKKINGEKSVEHYKGKKPEYTTMSRRPGIGQGWYQKYKSDAYPSDEIVFRNRGQIKKIKPPKYFDRLLEVEDLETFNKVKLNREELAKKSVHDNTPDRLKVKKQLKNMQFKQLKRSFETNE